MGRIDDVSKSIVWKKYLKDYRGNDTLVLNVVQAQFVDEAASNEEFWPDALKSIEHGYRSGSVMFLNYEKGEVKMPLRFATVVCECADKYPLNFVSYAESILATEAGLLASSVGSVASACKWFFPR